MINIDIKFTGHAFDGSMHAIFEQEYQRAMTESVLELETEVAGKTPVNFGTLRSGIQGRVVNPYFGEVGVSGPASIYAPVVELGRRPGKFPPPDAILSWVKKNITPSAGRTKTGRLSKRKLVIKSKSQESKVFKDIAFAVSKKIATEGIKGKFMFKKAERKLRRTVIGNFILAQSRAENRINGRRDRLGSGPAQTGRGRV